MNPARWIGLLLWLLIPWPALAAIISGTLTDSDTGAGLGGVRVVLQNLETGETFTALSSTGANAGWFQFPLLLPSRFQLSAQPDESSFYAFPSGRCFDPFPDTQGLELTAAPCGHAFELHAGRDQTFSVPLDALAERLFVRRSANKRVVARGDELQISVEVRNTSDVAIDGVTLGEALPRGFQLRPDSLRLANGRLLLRRVLDGEHFNVPLGTLAAGASVTLGYVLTTGAAQEGEVSSYSQAYSDDGAWRSNRTRLRHRIEHELLDYHALVTGRVLGPDGMGIGGVRIFLEDGRYAITDALGTYHFEGITPGSHVLQLDEGTLPVGLEPAPAATHSRSAGSRLSQFIDLQGGTLWQVDFELKQTQLIRMPPVAEFSVFDSAGPPQINEADADSPIVWLRPALAGRALTDRIDVEIRHLRGTHLALSLNGVAVRAGHHDEINTREQVSRWSGIKLETGPNIFLAIVLNEMGTEIARSSRPVHLPGKATEVELDTSRSQLVADGITEPRLALRFLDQWGYPVRAGVSGEFQFNSPHHLKQSSEFKLKNLIGGSAIQRRYKTDENGMTMLVLEPVADTADVRMVVPLVSGEQHLNVPLQPKPRDWVLVGMAEGTLGYNSLKGHIEAFDSERGESGAWQSGRMALFAKGRVRGKWLLTMAYDSASGETREPDLMERIDPRAYYTIYGDNSLQGSETASREKLYLKLEKDDFYALFGDFETRFDAANLTTYARSLTGLKMGWRQHDYELVWFHSNTGQSFVRDEIQGRGLTGPYRLSQGSVVWGSDSVRIETRDRFNVSQVNSAEALSRDVDYDLDHERGVITLRRPLASVNEQLDPQFLVVGFETRSDLAGGVLSGIRATRFLGDRTALGLTYVSDDSLGQDGGMQGVYVTRRFSRNHQLRFEAARSVHEGDEGAAREVEWSQRGEQWRRRAVFSERSEHYGIDDNTRVGQGQSQVLLETEGALDGRHRLRATLQHEDRIANQAQRARAEVVTTRRMGQTTAHAGLRMVNDALAGAPLAQTRQLLLGVNHAAMAQRLNLHVEREQALGALESADFPELTRLGVDYSLSDTAALFADQEFADGMDERYSQSRIGVKSRWWQGSEVTTSLNRQVVDSTSVSANVGLHQLWQVNDAWSADISGERAALIAGDAQMVSKASFAAGPVENYGVISLGLSYQPGSWLWTGRFESRSGDFRDRMSVATSAQLKSSLDTTLLTSLSLQDEHTFDVERRKGAAWRLDMTHRAPRKRWLVFNRVELKGEDVLAAGSQNASWRLVNNLSANYRLKDRWQAAFLYGIKLLDEEIDGASYASVIDLYGIEAMYDIASRWDLGVHSNLLHAWDSDQLDYSSGVSLGHSLMQNTWLSLGYNFSGFEEPDLGLERYTLEGAYLRLRLKFDQKDIANLIEKNRPSGTLFN